MKGAIKTTDRQTQQHLKQLHVHCTTPHKHTSASSSPSKTLRAHIMSIAKKRDKDTLKHKRNLVQAFRTTPDSQRNGPVLHHLLNISSSRPCCWVLWMWREPRAISLVWVHTLLCFAYHQDFYIHVSFSSSWLKRLLSQTSPNIHYKCKV